MIVGFIVGCLLRRLLARFFSLCFSWFMFFWCGIFVLFAFDSCHGTGLGYAIMVISVIFYISGGRVFVLRCMCCV